MQGIIRICQGKREGHIILGTHATGGRENITGRLQRGDRRVLIKTGRRSLAVISPCARKDGAVSHDSLPIQQFVYHPLPVQASQQGVTNIFILEEGNVLSPG